MDDPENGVNGICLRGKAGWGEGGAFITVTANSFGARWFDEDWQAQFDSRRMGRGAELLRQPDERLRPRRLRHQRLQREPVAVPAGPVRHVDRRHRCGVLRDQPQRLHRRGPGRLRAGPDTGLGPRSNWLWAWALAIPAGTQQSDAALQFIEWATSADYIELVAENEGWANVPPGARTSLYENPDYAEVPFAQMTLDSILAADPNNPTVDPVPYVGIQFVAIPEFAGIGPK
jgi:sorbitol/mannitol transport system substrate-binding protein